MFSQLRARQMAHHLSLLLGMAAGASSSFGQGVAAPRAGSAAPVGPAIASVEPTIVGVGTKIRIRGAKLGTIDDAAVLFTGGEVTTWIEKHTADEIVVQVPIGAQAGPIRVVVGAGDAERLSKMTPADRQDAVEAASSVASNQRLIVIAPFVKPAAAGEVVTTGGLKVLKSRLVVDLRDFRGFEDAVRIANQIGGELAGFVGPSNSYVIDLTQPPANLDGLNTIMDRVRQDPVVADVWHDMVLELGGVKFADSDVVRRYGITDPMDGDPYDGDPSELHGRMDVWAYDRIQAPAAWNLIKRKVVGPPAEVKVAVLDSGCDQTHREYDENGDGVITEDSSDVQLREVLTPPGGWVSLRIAGNETLLPQGLEERPYNRGDWHGHGTMVTSIIGALNGNDLGSGDRGMNGILAANGGPYTIQVYPDRTVGENSPQETVTAFLVAINSAAITGAQVLTSSYGQPIPINPLDPRPRNPNDPQDLVRVSLRKMARQLNQFRGRLLMCIAAGNDAEDPASYKGGEITPFEDFNLNCQYLPDINCNPDPGEDIDGDGALDHGNIIPGSLGTLPNVITVGAIGGPDLDPPGPDYVWARDDERADFSNYGSHPGGQDLVVQIAAPGVDVFAVRSNGRIVIGGQKFDRVDGTSFATPLVTGTAALLMAVDDKVRGQEPRLSPAQIKQLLLDTSFPVDTTDGLARPIKWNTLKAGNAVRKLLVDRGVIDNDEEWTGTSKIVSMANVDGCRTYKVSEVRQDPVTRHSMVFRETEILGIPDPDPDGPSCERFHVTLSQTGKEVAYYRADQEDESRHLMELDLEDDTSSDVLTNAPPFQGYMQRGLHHWFRYLPDGKILSSWTRVDPGTCPEETETGLLLLDEKIIAKSPDPPEWHSYSWLMEPAPRPDNRLSYVALDVRDTEYELNEESECVEGSAQSHSGSSPQLMHADPVETFPVPPGGDKPAWWASWSPCGRLFNAVCGWCAQGEAGSNDGDTEPTVISVRVDDDLHATIESGVTHARARDLSLAKRSGSSGSNPVGAETVTAFSELFDSDPSLSLDSGSWAAVDNGSASQLGISVGDGGTARAGVEYNDNPADWDDIATRVGEIDFDDDPDYGATGFSGPLTSAGAGPVSPGVVLDNVIIDTVAGRDYPINLAAFGPSFGWGNPSNGIVANYYADSLEISFTDPSPSAVMLNLLSVGGSSKVDVSFYDEQDVLIETVTDLGAPPAGHPVLFWTEKEEPFGRIVIEDVGGGAGQEGVMQLALYKLATQQQQVWRGRPPETANPPALLWTGADGLGAAAWSPDGSELLLSGNDERRFYRRDGDSFRDEPSEDLLPFVVFWSW